MSTAIPETKIESPKGIVPLHLHELWEYRELVYFMLWRDIKGRYRQMALGPLWMLINPLMNMLVFTLIFGVVAKLPSDGLPYPLFNYSALLPWGFFSSILFGAAGSLVASRDLITKVYFPRFIIPLVSVGAALFDFLLQFVILLGLMAWYGFVPSLAIVWLLVYLLLGACTGLAVGLWFAAWIAHFRDINAVLGYAVRVWMYATPVVYAASVVPEKWRTLYELNPMTVMIEGCRWALLGVGEGPGVNILIAFAMVLPILITGAYHFRRTERNIVDIA